MATVLKEKSEELNLHRLSLDDYHQLIEDGFFKVDDHVELIEGVLRNMTPKGSLHTEVIYRIRTSLEEHLQNRARVRTESPITVRELESEPEPDIAVVKNREQGYPDRHPYPDDVFLLVEVSVTSKEEDREIKKALYSSAGIPEYWIVKIPEKRVEVLQDPVKPKDHNDSYESVSSYESDAELSPEAFPDCRLDFESIFPDVE